MIRLLKLKKHYNHKIISGAIFHGLPISGYSIYFKALIVTVFY